MKWNFRFAAFLVMAVFVGAGCSVLPGLKVLSGQDTGDNAQNRLVETTELVMANKAGVTDPVLNGVADRIETAAAGSLDIIEIRNDLNSRTFQVYTLYLPDSTLSQADQVNRERRAFELVWRGIMQPSIGADTLNISLVYPVPVTTLDRGPGFVGYIIATATIARKDALIYLNGSPNLQNFVNLVTDGTLNFDQPASPPPYRGTPNHPVFMLAQLTQPTSSSGG
jgi:hypothetical protein